MSLFMIVILSIKKGAFRIHTYSLKFVAPSYKQVCRQVSPKLSMHTLFLLLRRSASFLYDCLLLIALFFIITSVLVVLNDGEQVAHPLYYLLLWIVGGMFFVGFWCKGGQTLGMRAWHLRVVANDVWKQHKSVSENQSLITQTQAWKRYIFGSVFFGVGYLWTLADREGLSAMDRLSGSKIIKDSNHLRKTS